THTHTHTHTADNKTMLVYSGKILQDFFANFADIMIHTKLPLTFGINAHLRQGHGIFRKLVYITMMQQMQQCCCTATSSELI
ncbi:MAG: hypothetical protein MPL62_16090, partial [Alphaproteobacteria bacterium]|nr:hypothetical protein [Alphaproteobacteria bacterium]